MDLTTRRTILGALAAAPAAALPALAAGPAPISARLAAVIERHKAAKAAVFAAIAATGDIQDDIADAESAAFDDVAQTPCATDAEFFVKIEHMLARQKELYEHEWTDDSKPVFVALDLHVNGVA